MNQVQENGIIKFQVPTSYPYRDWAIPEPMLGAIDRYLNHRIPPGGFWRAVLANDFVGVCGEADDDNIRNLPAYAAFLHNEMPAVAWGNPQSVREWVDGGNNGTGHG